MGVIYYFMGVFVVISSFKDFEILKSIYFIRQFSLKDVKMGLPSVGPRQITKLKNSLPTLVSWGAAAGIFGLFFTANSIGEFFLRNVPIYKRKYRPQPPEMS